MLDDPEVWECAGCGRLWVGYTGRQLGTGYTNSPGACLSEADMRSLDGGYGHAPPGPHGPGPVKGCHSLPYKVWRPATVVAFHLGGRAAAEAMTDGALKRSIEEYERRFKG